MKKYKAVFFAFIAGANSAGIKIYILESRSEYIPFAIFVIFICTIMALGEVHDQAGRGR